MWRNTLPSYSIRLGLLVQADSDHNSRLAFSAMFCSVLPSSPGFVTELLALLRRQHLDVVCFTRLN